MPTPNPTTFSVYKDASGRYRWIGVSSTAFRDRDKEIIETQALENDVAASDQSGRYGPLRWWHVGEPDAFNLKAPWGPGLDLGDCDFRAVHGRSLIESGTFRNEALGAAMVEAAPRLQMSIGFHHNPLEPGLEKTYTHIRTFERSLVPAGQASNPYTRFTVKEKSMLREKLAALKTLLGNDDELVQSVITQTEITEKAAERAGVAYKAINPVEEAQLPNEVAVTELAAPSEVLVEEPAIAGDADDTRMGDMQPEAFAQLIGVAIRQELAPLVSTMDLTKTIGGHMDELKTMMGSYSTKKDAESAAQSERLSALEAAIKANAEHAEQLKASLKELEGDQPTVAKGYRASQDPLTAIQDGSALKAAAPSADPVVDFFGSVNVLGSGQLPAS